MANPLGLFRNPPPPGAGATAIFFGDSSCDPHITVDRSPQGQWCDRVARRRGWTSVNRGGGGRGAILAARVAGGRIAGVDVLDPGTGYAPPGSAPFATTLIVAVPGATLVPTVRDGRITGATVTDAGTGYAAPPPLVLYDWSDIGPDGYRICAGIGGNTMQGFQANAGSVTDWDRVRRFVPGVVAMSFGINDCFVAGQTGGGVRCSLAGFRAAYATVLIALRSLPVNPYLLCLGLPPSPAPAGAPFADYAAAVADVAAAFGAAFIDLADLDPARHCTYEGIHLNAAGQQIVADRIERMLTIA